MSFEGKWSDARIVGVGIHWFFLRGCVQFIEEPGRVLGVRMYVPTSIARGFARCRRHRYRNAVATFLFFFLVIYSTISGLETIVFNNSGSSGIEFTGVRARALMTSLAVGRGRGFLLIVVAGLGFR